MPVYGRVLIHQLNHVMHINEHRFPGKKVCVRPCPHNYDMYMYINRLVVYPLLYGPHKKVSVDNPKANYTFSKDIMQ